MNQWDDSHFSIPELSIADPSPSANTSGEEETVSSIPVPVRYSSSSVISVTPLDQAAPSIFEATSDENSEVPLQSESVPELEINLVPSVPEVSSTSVTEPSLAEPQPPANRWTRSHLINQVIGKTRRQLGNICLFVNFVSLIYFGSLLCKRNSLNSKETKCGSLFPYLATRLL